MFKHIIWDFDGTLFDTYPVINQVLRETFLDNGIDEPLSEIMRLTKISMKYAVNFYERRYTLCKDFWKQYNEKVKKEEIVRAVPFQGVKEICKLVSQNEGYHYLLTHRGESAFILLEKQGLLRYFRECITSGDGFARKPSPEGILYLLNKYQMNPKETIMIGDREIDILSGKNAGVSSCYFNIDGVFDVEADYYIRSIEQLKDMIN